MTQAVSVRTIRPAESRLIAAVCGAHFMSHYYMLLLAPLFVFVRGDFKVSYTELALALTVFNVVSGILQTPVGFLVDRIGARMVLIVGLAVSTVAYAIAGLANSYWVFIAMYGLGGLGNTVFHPADYSLLSHHAPKERLGQVFAFHTFAGIVGSAIAPVTLLFMQAYFGWRGAYVGASIVGFIVLFVLIAQPEPSAETPHAANAPAKSRADVRQAWRVLLTPPILLNLGYFILTSIMGGGLNTYLVVALGALHATPVDIANMALTSLLAMNAVGVLAGGMLAGRTSHHALVAATGLAVGGVVTALVGLVRFSRRRPHHDDGTERLLCRRDLSVARHVGARSDAGRRLRPRVRLCQRRLQHRCEYRAHHLRRADGQRHAALGLHAVGRRQHRVHLDRHIRVFQARGAVKLA